MSNHWNEPKICIGCETEPCTEDPDKCLSDELDRQGDIAFDRMRDERDDQNMKGYQR